MGRIFEGIKVADFAWVGVGPMAARILADNGATVVRIESMTRPDPLRVMGPFKDNVPGINRSWFGTICHCNKYSVSLNLNHPKAAEVGKRFFEWADVVTEAFTPGQMRKWGLDYEAARKVKPDIIYYSTCMQGQTGPHRFSQGFGLHMAALAGFYHVTGWPDRAPVGPYGAYSDFIAGLFMQIALLAALDYRRRTGRGQYIDLSQLEAALPFLAPPIMDYIVNGRELNRMGNRNPSAAPHGAYPCRGEDRWVAIAVFSDEEWQSFCRVLGDPDWSKDPRFATLLARKENEDELDRLIGEWTIGFTPEQVMAMMQAAGVAAGAVQKVSDLFSDPQLKHRQHYIVLEHEEIGPHVYQNTPVKLSKTLPEMRTAAPLLGQHTEYVYKEFLGLSDNEIADLMAEGVLQ